MKSKNLKNTIPKMKKLKKDNSEKERSKKGSF